MVELAAEAVGLLIRAILAEASRSPTLKSCNSSKAKTAQPRTPHADARLLSHAHG